MIGGTAPNVGNTIAFNSGPGVQVNGPTAKGNSILSNSMYSNSMYSNGSGIVLTGGANDNRAAPTLTAAASSPGSTLVEGTLAVAAGTSYLVQYFYNNPPSNQGRTLLGSQTISSPASGTVNLSFSTAATVLLGSAVTATATVQFPPTTFPEFFDTSEFSNAVAVVSPFVVTNTWDSGIGSLRQAILTANANPGPDTITFASGLSGTIVLTSGELQITDDVTIDGPGAALISVSGNNASRVFEVDLVHAAISGLTITGGNAYGDIIQPGWGGGIWVASGTLTVNQSTISRNTAAQGGGISAGFDSTVTVNQSTISSNSALAGGGIYSLGNLTLSNVVVKENLARGKNGADGSGDAGQDAQGGGIYCGAGVLSLINHTQVMRESGPWWHRR